MSESVPPQVPSQATDTVGQAELPTPKKDPEPTQPLPTESIDETAGDHAHNEVTMPLEAKYLIIDSTTDPDAAPNQYGYFVEESGEQMTNFTTQLLEEQVVEDGPTDMKSLKFRLHGDQVSGEFTIPIADLYKDRALMAAVTNTAGAEARIWCKPSELREAMLEHAKVVEYHRQHVTLKFGWNEDKTAYRFPGGSIDRDGFHLPGPDDWRVDLRRGQFAKHLDLAAPPDNLAWWKQHLWEDLIGINDRRVTLSLLGASGAAVLFPFLEGVNHFGLWLAGKSGTGKSFAAQLFQNLFGIFPPGKGNIPTWASTVNFLQAEGYFFKDALYLLDDYKREVIDSTGGVIRLIQNYADGTARGRLKGGSGLDATRPIRGLLVSTGESVPDYSSSAVSRLVVVPVPEGKINTERGSRCLGHCHGYPGVMSAFIHHLLVSDRLEQFSTRQAESQAFFLARVAELPNALRVAGNLGTLAAATEEWGVFLHDAVPNAVEDILKFIEEDLTALRNDLLVVSRDRHPEDTYLGVLADLVKSDRVHIKDLNRPGQKVVGKLLRDTVVAVSLPWSMDEVNKELRRLGRRFLTPTQRQLLDYLRDDGILVDEEGVLLPPTAKADPKVVRIEGKPTRCLLIRRQSLNL